MRDERFIHTASMIARHSTHYKARVGAIIAKGACILSTGINQLKTHTRQTIPLNWKVIYRLPGTHAELDAIIGMSRKDLRGTTIYVARILANGDLALARPCSACQDLLRSVGIKKVVYSTGDKIATFKIEKI
jgi:deoxycytidylate deaminase